MHNIDLKDYSYDLPQERIAEFPTKDRSKSKLLLAKINPNEITHHTFSDLPHLLPEKSLLVLNDSKVIRARLNMKKSTGKKIEVFLLEPISPSHDPIITLNTKNECTWKCIIGGKKVKVGSELIIDNPDYDLKAFIITKNGNEAEVKFNYSTDKLSFGELIEKLGKVPLPPYIKRDNVDADSNRYQTVFARHKGSVAAPTAGLHLDNDILSKIKNDGHQIEKLTLHVGLGTFKPIDNNDLKQHDMHSEFISITKQSIQNIYNYLTSNKEAHIISIGTTSLRTLESTYWFGVKLISNDFTHNDLLVEQWDAYNLDSDIEASKALVAVIEWLDKWELGTLQGYTKLLIVPGYEFKLIKGLVTNFHAPKSTLILLVAALLGNKLWDEVYQTALDNDYRFLSYGDANLYLT